MQHFDPQQLLARIEQILPAQNSGRWCVAFSGGLDSSVLLHALAVALPPDSRQRLRAIYVDHQLQPQSGAWHLHCEQVCRTLGLAYQQIVVTVRIEPGASVEAAARTARYAALREALVPEEVLLTAHHADDQLETVLLALLRGSGIKGLAAMPAIQRFGAGWHARPLLGQTRAVLEHWALAEGLAWITDPSNQALDFDRNFLRSRVIPRLRTRWPAAAHSASRTALHAAEADQLLQQVAQADARDALVESCLKVSALAALSGPRRRNLLRYWLRASGASMPSTRKLASMEHDMLAARRDRLPCTEWDRCAVRRHRDLLYCTAAEPAVSCQPLLWEWSTPLSLGPLGCLQAEVVESGGLATSRLPQHLSVCFRPDAERALFAARGQQGKLKKLLQKAQVLPWCRDQVPLVLLDGWLLAIGDWWLSEKFTAPAGEQGVRFVWREQPRIRAVDN